MTSPNDKQATPDEVQKRVDQWSMLGGHGVEEVRFFSKEAYTRGDAWAVIAREETKTGEPFDRTKPKESNPWRKMPHGELLGVGRSCRRGD